MANAAGIGLSTVVDFEKTRRVVSPDSLTAIRAALEAAGVQFLDNGDVAGGAGVALR